MVNDVVTWTAVGLAVGAIIAIGRLWSFYSDRITKVEERAKAAFAIAEESKDDAKEANEKATLLSASFGLYREQIAREYIHREVMREVEERLTSAIDRLGDRLDRVLDRSESGHPARPHR